MAFAFLIGTLTSSTAVSIMATFAVFFLSAILANHDRIAAALSAEWAAALVQGLYWVFPKTAQLGAAVVALVLGEPGAAAHARGPHAPALHHDGPLRRRLPRPRVPEIPEKGLLTMKRLAVLPTALAFAAALALPAAARSGDDALSRPGRRGVRGGVIHVTDLRTSPLAARVFSDTDHVCVGGDAAHFLAEARLNPKEDVDTVVAAGSPKGAGGSAGWGLVLFEGRFDPAALLSGRR